MEKMSLLVLAQQKYEENNWLYGLIILLMRICECFLKYVWNTLTPKFIDMALSKNKLKADIRNMS